MNKKWIIYIVLIVVAFVLIVVFSKNIYFWLSNQLWKILLLAAVFGGGWLLGRFGGKKNGPAWTCSASTTRTLSS